MIQPDPHVPNCTFVRDDAESEWLFHTAERPEGIKFDFIHLRMVVTCFDDPRIVIKQAFDNMNPGGWIEFQDMYNETGDPTQEASPMYLIWKAMLQGAASRGRDLHGPAKYEAWLKEAGCKGHLSEKRTDRVPTNISQLWMFSCVASWFPSTPGRGIRDSRRSACGS